MFYNISNIIVFIQRCTILTSRFIGPISNAKMSVSVLMSKGKQTTLCNNLGIF